MRNNKGFSLVELIVVIAIMAILAAVAIPTFATFIDKANTASDVSFINDLEYAAELAHTATGADVTDVQVTVEAGAITGATYKVGEVTVTIAKDGTEWKATATNPAEGASEATVNAAVTEAAADAVKAVDWDYKFKSETAGTFKLASADAKALTPVTGN